MNYGPGEEDLAREVESASEGTAKTIKSSISELIALTRRAKLFIGGDTGPLHLAAALQVPVMAIFGPTDPARNGPYGTRSIVLRNPASPTTHARKPRPDEGMLEIGVGAVVDAARTVAQMVRPTRRVLMAEWSRVARRIRVPLGFAFAVLYFWLARPTWRFIAFGAILIVPGLLIRALASGHVRKNEALATSGPYAYTRNPLYLGSLLIGVGFAVAARSWWVGVVLVLMFFAIYMPVIRSEEEFLREKFSGL